MRNTLLLLMAIIPFIATKAQEKWRPKFHFSPEKNWVNDPNGLIYLDGEWHLFFQHNPFENKWGHMSWGHAVSKDLLTWEELPIAIPEGEEEFIFSGSVVNDKNNTSGFFKDKNGLIAIYTADYHGQKENQHLAYSVDKGRTWTKLESNPILAEPNSIDGLLGVQKDFRDPNVFWHEQTQKWIMAVVLPKKYLVQFYSSDNLQDWEWESDFGNIGDIRKIWECPGMTQVPIYDLDGKEIGRKWLLMISSSGTQDGFTGMQYFTGNFDGKSFTPDNEQWPKYLDHGKDFYAAIPFNNTDKSLILGWFSNWKYAQAPPTPTWKGQMSIVRELSFLKTREGLTLRQKPQLQSGNWNKAVGMDQMPLNSAQGIEWRTNGMSYRIKLDFEVAGNNNFGIHFLMDNDEVTTLKYSPAIQELSLDRTQSGVEVDSSFPSIERVFLPLKRNTLSLEVIVDQCTIEVFANNGEAVISDLVFPAGKGMTWKVFGNDPQGKVKNIEVLEWE